MKNKYLIEKVDHLNFSDEDWKCYFDFRMKSDALKGKPMRFDSVEELKTHTVKGIKENGKEIYQVWKNEQENGLLVFSTEFKDDLNKRFTDLENSMNDEHLEADLLAMIFKEYIEYDEASNFLLVFSKDGMNDYVTDLFNAKIGTNSFLYELHVKEANFEKIDTWLTESKAKFPNFRIEFYSEIPDDLLEEYATVLTQFSVDAKSTLGDPTWTASEIKGYQEKIKVMNHTEYSYFIFNEANKLIAITHARFNLKQPKEIDQGMTGVLKKYRGLGLSKWLKAEMFTKLLADYPAIEKIKTETIPENHPSRELSKQMGYKQIGNEKEFLIDRANIVQYLNTNI